MGTTHPVSPSLTQSHPVSPSLTLSHFVSLFAFKESRLPRLECLPVIFPLLVCFNLLSLLVEGQLICKPNTTSPSPSPYLPLSLSPSPPLPLSLPTSLSLSCLACWMAFLRLSRLSLICFSLSISACCAANFCKRIKINKREGRGSEGRRGGEEERGGERRGGEERRRTPVRGNS